MKIPKNKQKYLVAVMALLIFSIVLTGAYLFATKRITLSRAGGLEFHLQKQDYAGKTDCSKLDKVAQGNTECLFIGCNGFF